MKLTDRAINTAKPKEKPYKLADGHGMYLEISPTGGKWWRLKYRMNDKEKRLSLGTYPEVSLKDARKRRDEAREQIAKGTDPSEQRKAAKTAKRVDNANTFELLAREWLKTKTKWTPEYAAIVKARMEKDLFPTLGNRPTREITASEVLDALHKVEDRGAIETAHRLLAVVNSIFNYAISSKRLDVGKNPAPSLKASLKEKPDTQHMAAILDPQALGGFLRSADDYSGSSAVRCALRLLPLVFVRPGVLRRAEWEEINFETANWEIPAQKMKKREALIVPLSPQAIAILHELQQLTGRGRYLFPGQGSRTRPMSNNAVLSALRRMGYEKDEVSGHGFRATARTLLDEVLGERPDLIEHQLAHRVRDANGRAYNRTSHLVGRRAMMNRWANYLDVLRAGAEILPYRQQANT